MSASRGRKSEVMNRIVGLICASLMLFVFGNRIEAGSLPLDTIKLPPGFTITVYADNVPNARGMALGRDGTLFVSTKDKGDVYAVLDKDGDQRADEVLTIARGLNMPAGVAYQNGSLYVAAVDRLLRYDDIDTQLKHVPPPVVLTDRFPKDARHGWNLSPSVPMESSMCRWERPAIAVNPIPIAMLSSAASILTGADTRSSRAGSETQSASIGTRRLTSYGSPKMAGITSVTINRRTNSTMQRSPVCTSAIPIAMEEQFQILSMGANMRAENSRRPPPSLALTSPPWACVFTPAPCSLRNIGIRSLSPNMGRGIGARK